MAVKSVIIEGQQKRDIKETLNLIVNNLTFDINYNNNIKIEFYQILWNGKINIKNKESNSQETLKLYLL